MAKITIEMPDRQWKAIINAMGVARVATRDGYGSDSKRRYDEAQKTVGHEMLKITNSPLTTECTLLFKYDKPEHCATCGVKFDPGMLEHQECADCRGR